MGDLFVLRIDKKTSNKNLFEKSFVEKSINKHINFTNNFFDVNLYYNNEKNVIYDKEKMLCLFILGPLPYLFSQYQMQNLLYEIEKKGINTIYELKNHFFILFIDWKNNKINLFTDKVSSNKVLFYENNESYFITNSIYNIPLGKVKIDLAALGSFLVNDGLINKRSLIENVVVLEAGTYYSLFFSNEELRLNSKKYWELKFTNEFKNIPESVLRKELEQVLIKSVEINIPAAGNIFLSLSAGYDSSSIFAILSKLLNVKDIKTFTYKFGKVKRDGDEYLASRIAKLYNQKHCIIESFKGNLLKVIIDNAKLLNGFSNTCGESDVWVNFELDDSENNFIFVGDQFFGYLNNYKAKDIYEMLFAHLLYNFDILPFKEPYIKNNYLELLINRYNSDLEEFIENLPQTENADTLDTIYFKYRLLNKITPWRQNFTGLKFVVLNPFITDFIIDFMTKVPGNIRNHKKLFQDTVQGMFPELFEIKRATSINVGNYWEIFLFKQKDDIISDLINSSSPLDELMDKNEIINLIKNYNYILSYENLKKYTIENVKRILRKFKYGDKIIKKYKTKKSLITISKATFLRRYLILRKFYELIQNGNSY